MRDIDGAQLRKLRQVWTELGADDPLWAVLSRSDKRGGRWNVDEFLATGQAEIDAQLALLARSGWPRRHRRALDFGCGAGRLARALALHFDEVLGIDVSESMLATAARIAPLPSNVRLQANASPRIDCVADASVDLVYSCITLQHIPPRLAVGYIGEFLRVLAPGGAAAFQFVAGADRSPRGRLFALLPNRALNLLRRVRWRRRAVFEMHALDRAAVLALVDRDPGLHLLEEREDGAAGTGWRSLRWTVVREA